VNVLLGKVKAFLKGRKKKESESEGLVREWMDAGFSLLQEGDSLGAQKLFEKILNVQPNNSDALYLLGVILSNQGELTQSTTLLKKAITADSSIASYHLTLANVFAQTGNTDESLVCYLRAVELDPQDPESRTGLGNALLECKQFGDAKAHFAEALRMVPDAALAHYNIAVANQALNLTVEAIKYYRNAILKNPLLVQAENNIGVIYFSSRDYDCAIASFRRVSQLQPDFALGWENLGIALQANRSLDEACACLRRAIELNPDSFNAYSNLALALREQGKLHESQESSLRALSIKDSLGERIRISTLIPVIASSADSIEEWRRKFSEGLDRLMLRGGNVVDPLKEIGVCNFNLAYQPKCNRDLQIKSATLYSSLCPSLNYTAQHCQVSRARTDSRIKVGFISKFMFNHSIGRTTRGLVAKMSRERFHVVALFVPPMVDDSISSFIWQHSDQQISLPSDLQDARERIAALELDVLFYQDIGMDAYTYFLAYSRLATVQCVSFGHPDTTGIPNMDYWVSSEYFETAMAKDHYSEKLFLLKDVGVIPPISTGPRSRTVMQLWPDVALG
jgi:tetratricopeptide (TPR) repeat protein